MLLKEDIELVKETRKEITNNRTMRVVIKGKYVKDKDPVTGEIIEGSFEEKVDAIVSEVSTRLTDDRYLEGGILIETGDIDVHVPLESIPESIADSKVDEIEYRGEDYKVLSSDLIGLGELNRMKLIGRLKT